VGLGFDSVADGSTQIKPNHSFDVHSCEAVDVSDTDVLVAGCLVDVVESWQPNQPGDLHVVLEVVCVAAEEEKEEEDEEEGVEDEEATVEVVVTVGAGAGVARLLVMVVVSVVVTSSLHPNQPGERQVVVVIVCVVVTGTVILLVSSKHPHQPGVLHVSVLVRVVDVEVEEELVVVSVPLLSKNFHSKQSIQSSCCMHLGTASYFWMTSWMMTPILWLPMPCLHPKSVTVS
jgi:hypothetical protein